MCAAAENSRQAAELLISRHCDVHRTLANGDTALALAASKDSIDVMKPLVDAGADIETQNENGWTALMLAAYTNAKQAADYVISLGTDVNMTTNFGSTPVTIAAHHDSADVLKSLLAAGADVNEQNVVGDTALICAAEQRSLRCFRELLQHGARRDLRNSDGFSVADILRLGDECDDPAVKVKQRAMQRIYADLDPGRSAADEAATATASENNHTAPSDAAYASPISRAHCKFKFIFMQLLENVLPENNIVYIASPIAFSWPMFLYTRIMLLVTFCSTFFIYLRCLNVMLFYS